MHGACRGDRASQRAARRRTPLPRPRRSAAPRAGSAPPARARAGEQRVERQAADDPACEREIEAIEDVVDHQRMQHLAAAEHRDGSMPLLRQRFDQPAAFRARAVADAQHARAVGLDTRDLARIRRVARGHVHRASRLDQRGQRRQLEAPCDDHDGGLRRETLREPPLKQVAVLGVAANREARGGDARQIADVPGTHHERVGAGREALEQAPVAFVRNRLRHGALRRLRIGQRDASVEARDEVRVDERLRSPGRRS